MAILTLNKCIILILCLAIAFFHHGDGKKQSKKAPRGHLQQLGLHRDPEGHVDIITEPLSAKEFWTKYVSKRRPVLLRGAASSFPAKELWVDSYLSDTYGNLSLKIEGKLEEDPNPVGDMGLARDTIKHFMNTYVQDDKYVISQLPKPMYGDVLIPPCMSCGLFKDSIIEVNFWLSSGGTRSLLHKDAPNILNCLLNGTKNWLMFNPKHEHMVPLAREPSLAGGGYSVLDVDRVNLIKYPKFKDCPYHYANVTAGDCLYVPYGSLHHVRSSGNKNMAVSFLFSRTITHNKEFDNTGCDKPVYKNLKDTLVAWDFDGVGSLTMGLNEPIFYRKNILKAFKGKNNITTKLLITRVKRTMLPDDVEKSKLAVSLLKRNLKLENKKYITQAELSAVPLGAYKEIIASLETDPSNTLQYEYFQFSQAMIKQAFDHSTRRDGGINSEKFIKIYKERIHGSEKIAKELLQKLDENSDGIITKSEKAAKIKKVLGLFEKSVPDEHSNDYQDVYVYRKEREEVPDEDEMEYHYEENYRPIDDGAGIPVNKEERSNDDDNGGDDEGNGDGAEFVDEREEIMHEEL